MAALGKASHHNSPSTCILQTFQDGLQVQVQETDNTPRHRYTLDFIHERGSTLRSDHQPSWRSRTSLCRLHHSCLFTKSADCHSHSQSTLGANLPEIAVASFHSTASDKSLSILASFHPPSQPCGRLVVVDHGRSMGKLPCGSGVLVHSAVRRCCYTVDWSAHYNCRFNAGNVLATVQSFVEHDMEWGEAETQTIQLGLAPTEELG